MPDRTTRNAVGLIHCRRIPPLVSCISAAKILRSPRAGSVSSIGVLRRGRKQEGFLLAEMKRLALWTRVHTVPIHETRQSPLTRCLQLHTRSQEPPILQTQRDRSLRTKRDISFPCLSQSAALRDHFNMLLRGFASARTKSRMFSGVCCFRLPSGTNAFSTCLRSAESSWTADKARKDARLNG